MRKSQTLNRIVSIMALLLSVSACQTLTSGSIFNTPRLKFNTQDFSPFSYKTNGVVSGPAADVIRRVCAEAQIDCKIALLDWKTAQKEVKNGRANGLFVIGWNAPRTEWLHFTDPLLKTEYGFFADTNSVFEFKSIDDLKGRTIVVYGPSNTLNSLKQLKTQLRGRLNIIVLPDSKSVFHKLSRDKTIDAAFSNRDTGRAYIARMGLKNLRYAGGHKELLYYAGISKKTNKNTVDQFTETFRNLQRSGVIRDILGRYGMQAASSISCSTSLRAMPLVLSENDVLHMRNELEDRLYSAREFNNLSCDYDQRFKKGDAGLVTDFAANLTWQNSPQYPRMTWEQTHDYLNRINKEKYGGHRNWRLPTIEEIHGLMRYGKTDDDSFLNHMVQGSAIPFWTADKVRFTSNIWTADVINDLLAPVHRGEILSVVAVRSND